MATRTQKQWTIGLAMIVTVVGGFALLIALTRTSDTPAPTPAVSASTAAGALYALDGQLVDIGDYVAGATSNQVDINVANDLATFAKNQLQELDAWGEKNHVDLSELRNTKQVEFAQSRGLLQTILSQRNAALHTTFKQYLARVQTSLGQADLSQIAEEMRSRITDTANEVTSAVTTLG